MRRRNFSRNVVKVFDPVNLEQRRRQRVLGDEGGRAAFKIVRDCTVNSTFKCGREIGVLRRTRRRDSMSLCFKVQLNRTLAGEVVRLISRGRSVAAPPQSAVVFLSLEHV